MARLRQQIPVVVKALRKTQKSYKRNFDLKVATRNADVKIGDYVYTTNHDRKNKLQGKAIGLFVVLDADASTFVIDIDGEEKRVRSDQVTPAPRPTTTDTVPQPLIDGLDKPKKPLATADEYVVDKLLGLRQTGDTYSGKVRCFDYGSKNDTWHLLKNLPREHGFAIPSTEEETRTGIRLASANTAWPTISRADLCNQRRNGPHMDFHHSTCACHRGWNYPCRRLLVGLTRHNHNYGGTSCHVA